MTLTTSSSTLDFRPKRLNPSLKAQVYAQVGVLYSTRIRQIVLSTLFRLHCQSCHLERRYCLDSWRPLLHPRLHPCQSYGMGIPRLPARPQGFRFRKHAREALLEDPSSSLHGEQYLHVLPADDPWFYESCSREPEANRTVRLNPPQAYVPVGRHR